MLMLKNIRKNGFKSACMLRRNQPIKNYHWGMSIGAQTKKNPSRQIFARLKKIHSVILERLSVFKRLPMLLKH